jgi:hypothetical protein
MTARDLTADNIADWLTPSQAIEILDAFYDNRSPPSKHALLERLRGGMVQAVAGHSAFDGRRRWREVLYKIPSDDWEKVDTADPFWITGDLTYKRREYGSSDTTTARHFDVRFEPQSVRAIVGMAGNVSQVAQAQPSSVTDVESESKGPRVADTHLQAWFEFYKKIHSEAEDTDDRALGSARMNFQGKSVSRERVRALRGSQRRGPKKKIE